MNEDGQRWNDYELITEEIADAVNLTTSQIRRLAKNELQDEGLAKKFGNGWRFKKEVIPYLKCRPEKRGRKKTREIVDLKGLPEEKKQAVRAILKIIKGQ